MNETHTQRVIRYERALMKKLLKELARLNIKTAQLTEELLGVMEQNQRLTENTKTKELT